MDETATGHVTARKVTCPPRDGGQDPPAAKGGGLRVIARGIYRNDRKLQLGLLAFMVMCYGALLGISWRLAMADPLRLTFNSMLAHLLHGRFDVDPQIVGVEGFQRNSRVYAYWGIWCALLRLPLWILRRMDVDVTIWSCLAAFCIAGMAKVRAVLFLRRHGPRNPMASWAIGLMLAYVLLGGSAIAYLQVSIYQEVIAWAYAFATAFVYFTVKGVVIHRFDLKALCCMALCAGLAFLTRVSTGIGLVLALVLLLLALALESDAASAPLRQPAMQRLALALARRRILLPLCILAVFIAATGVVNYFRWGNPMTFADYKLYIFDRYFSDRVPRLSIYGLFNFDRIPFGLVYYFVPIWVLHGSGGQLLLEKTRTQLLDAAELPPSSLLLTDLLPLCFIAFLAVALWRRRSHSLPPVGRWAAAVAVGLLAPCILMLAAIYMAYRYRMEFDPEIEFLAFLGLYLTVTDEVMLAKFARFRRSMAAALAISIACGFVSLELADVGQPTPPQPDPQGLVHFYFQATADHFHKTLARHFASR